MDELRELLDTRGRVKESIISCSKKDIKTIETSKKDLNTHLLEKRDMTSELSITLQTEIVSGNKLQRFSKENQDEPKRMNESGLMSKGIEEEKERILSCWKEDIQEH